jgi:long-chain acyl-CoA synthetase
MTALLLEAWERTVSADPSAVALIDTTNGRTWTRAAVEASAAEWHAAHGAGLRGQTVAFAELNGVNWLTVFLGILKSDGVACPLDSGEPVAARQTTAQAIGSTGHWYNGNLVRFESSRRATRDGRRVIKLTSGSTGAPRALAFTDAEMLADGRNICAGMGLASADLNLGIIPWGHSYGLGNLVIPHLLQGTAILFNVPPLPQAIASYVRRWQPTVFPAVPALLKGLAQSDLAAEDLSSLRTIISAGAPLAPEIAQSFQEKFSRKIHNFYGSSETGGICYDATGDSADNGSGVGRPLPGVRLAFGRGGRFTVSSDAVFTLGNRRPGTYRTGDIGQLSASGELVLVGRAGRFVKIGGRRLNLAEVERVLTQLPGVEAALVILHPHRADVLAAAVATPQSGIEIREALRTRLASWKIPKKILTLPQFPLTPRGKTDTYQLREKLRDSATP